MLVGNPMIACIIHWPICGAMYLELGIVVMYDMVVLK